MDDIKRVLDMYQSKDDKIAYLLRVVEDLDKYKQAYRDLVNSKKEIQEENEKLRILVSKSVQIYE